MALSRAIESAEPPERRLFADPFAAALLSGPLKTMAVLAGRPGIGRAVRRVLDTGWPGARSSGVVGA